MVERPLWLQRIREAWERRPVVWLSGVRRVGKTTLAKMLGDATYLNCDLPSVQRALADPELFYEGLPPRATVILDEVHRLQDPSGVLKIAADEYQGLRVLATGSSTLAATRKFRDSLTGRKTVVHLCPVPWHECAAFDVRSLDRRLLHGGLPEPLLAASKDPAFFVEWVDSFYARDILELFGVRNREGFLTLFRLLLRRSGGQLDISALASLAEVSRPTVKAHVEALRIAGAVHLLRPFHGGPGGSKQEIVSRPKCYAFDTGFVAHERGWDAIRDDDRGLLWEHLVLDALLMRFPAHDVLYWQDKARREVDFVVRRAEGRVDLVECKVNPDKLNPAPITAFRKRYPKGGNYIATPLARTPYRIRRGGRSAREAGSPDEELVFSVCSTRDVGSA